MLNRPYPRDNITDTQRIVFLIDILQSEKLYYGTRERKERGSRRSFWSSTSSAVLRKLHDFLLRYCNEYTFSRSACDNRVSHELIRPMLIVIT